MHRLWTALVFIGRWLGPALLLLALCLILFPFSPFLDLSGLLALAGGIVSATGWFVGRKSEHVKSKRILAATAIIGLAYFGFSTWLGPSGLWRSKNDCRETDSRSHYFASGCVKSVGARGSEQCSDGVSSAVNRRTLCA
jgi:hypothetical protein